MDLVGVLDQCRSVDCPRVIAPGAEYCCGSCHLASSVVYLVPDTASLGHTELCSRRQEVHAQHRRLLPRGDLL